MAHFVNRNVLQLSFLAPFKNFELRFWTKYFDYTSFSIDHFKVKTMSAFADSFQIYQQNYLSNL